MKITENLNFQDLKSPRVFSSCLWRENLSWTSTTRYFYQEWKFFNICPNDQGTPLNMSPRLRWSCTGQKFEGFLPHATFISTTSFFFSNIAVKALGARWDSLGAAWTIDIFLPRQINIQHLAVKEKQSTKRLVVRRSWHFALSGQHGQKRLHLGRFHLARMPHSMPTNEKLDPM